MVASKFEQITYICEEYNKFQDSKLIFMISDFEAFPAILTAILRLLQTKTPLSTIYNFYCCIVKEGWTLKVA